jgi:hypothetical protein
MPLPRPLGYFEHPPGAVVRARHRVRELSLVRALGQSFLYRQKVMPSELERSVDGLGRPSFSPRVPGCRRR